MTTNRPLKPHSIPWAQTALFQALVVQLIQTRVLTVENAQWIFEIALEKAKQQEPDAAGILQEIHNSMPWDSFYSLKATKKRVEKRPRKD